MKNTMTTKAPHLLLAESLVSSRPELFRDCPKGSLVLAIVDDDGADISTMPISAGPQDDPLIPKMLAFPDNTVPLLILLGGTRYLMSIEKHETPAGDVH